MKLHLKIDGKLYDTKNALSKPKLNDLLELKQQTGLGMKTLLSEIIRMASLPEQDSILDDVEALTALKALVWLVRRTEGELTPFIDAGEIELSKIQVVMDFEEDVDGDTPRPTVAPDANLRPSRGKKVSGKSKTLSGTSSNTLR